jgi:hypothetical protein
VSDSVHDFFIGDSSDKHFHQVIALHESPDLKWETIRNLAPLLPRGWYELARLSLEDRIEFTHDYWQSKLPFMAELGVAQERKLRNFFQNLEEIGIYVTQAKKGGAFDVHMVYSLKGAAGFFQGSPPATDETLDTLIRLFGHIHFPPDYLAFLCIHDGFSKYTDTGVIKSRDMAKTYQKLQHLLAEEILVSPDGQLIDPENLIPFYESVGLHCYQCFYADWYPVEEMGNVYFSEYDRTMSNFLDPESLEDNLAFPSFIGWLIFYLEDIGHV